MKTALIPTCVLAAALAGCIRTAEMPLAPNVVRLDTQAQGLLFTGQATSQTQKRAAELTLQNGFTHFRLEQAQLAQGSNLAGVYSSGSATATGSPGFAAVSGSGMSTPIYAPTTSVGVTVVMYHDNEPGAAGAFDARQVLANLSK